MTTAHDAGTAGTETAFDPALTALLSRAADTAKRPVERWNPPYCGDLDLRIAADGRWFYLGSPITREALVALFASILRRDPDGRHYLVSPVEKIGITVEDAPFLAVEMVVAGDAAARSITLRTNLGDVVTAGPAHPLRFAIEPATGGLKPYVLVRGGLEARLSRALAFDLVASAEESEVAGALRLGAWSGGVFFPFEPIADGDPDVPFAT